MPALTPAVVQQIDDTTAHTTTSDIAAYLRDALGQRVAAYMAGAADPKQIGDYVRGRNPTRTREQRLREGYKVVRMIEAAYDAETAKVWLFGTNSRLDDHAPIEVLGAARGPAEFTAVRRAARQFATVEA